MNTNKLIESIFEKILLKIILFLLTGSPAVLAILFQDKIYQILGDKTMHKSILIGLSGLFVLIIALISILIYYFIIQYNAEIQNVKK